VLSKELEKIAKQVKDSASENITASFVNLLIATDEAFSKNLSILIKEIKKLKENKQLTSINIPDEEWNILWDKMFKQVSQAVNLAKKQYKKIKK